MEEVNIKPEWQLVLNYFADALNEEGKFNDRYKYVDADLKSFISEIPDIPDYLIDSVCLAAKLIKVNAKVTSIFNLKRLNEKGKQIEKDYIALLEAIEYHKVLSKPKRTKKKDPETGEWWPFTQIVGPPKGRIKFSIGAGKKENHFTIESPALIDAIIKVIEGYLNSKRIYKYKKKKILDSSKDQGKPSTTYLRNIAKQLFGLLSELDKNKELIDAHKHLIIGKVLTYSDLLKYSYTGENYTSDSAMVDRVRKLVTS